MESLVHKTARSKKIAAALLSRVHTMYPTLIAGLRKPNPFRVLIATVLSIRTQDKTTEKAAARLFEKAPTPETLAALSLPVIRKLIYPVGMYPSKARWIKTISKMLLEQYAGQVPQTREALLAFPGVGRKVTNLVLGVCFGVPAICVDTHVHRISNRLGLVKTVTPEQTEYALENVLPKTLWVPWNDMLVVWGQNICTPNRPKCSDCILFQKRLCPQVGVANPR